MDAIHIKIREGQVHNRPIYVVMGITLDGERDVLGLWAGPAGGGEGARGWMSMLTELKNRGVQDVLIAWNAGPTEPTPPAGSPAGRTS